MRIVGPESEFGDGWDAAAKQDEPEFRRLDARIAELEAALRPFAEFNTEDYADDVLAFADDPSLMMGHFRAAQRALANK